MIVIAGAIKTWDFILIFSSENYRKYHVLSYPALGHLHDIPCVVIYPDDVNF